MHTDLSSAIDRVYEELAIYARPATFLACGCCWSGRKVRGAHWRGTSRPVVVVDAPGGDRPLRSLPADEALAEIASEVPLTGGTVEVLKHYLPRLLEIVASRDFHDPWLFDIEIVLSRLSDRPEVGGVPWWEWPPGEQAAIQQYLEALWARARRSSLERADETICAIGLAAPDVRPYVEAWLADPDAAAAAALAADQQSNADSMGGDDLWDLFWDTEGEPASTNCARVVAWLTALGPASS